MTKKMKEIYNLGYDKSGFKSGLINWYDKMIDKTYNELDVIDISKMIRQNILKDVAINRAIDLFIIDPYDGEMYDGDLLNTISLFDPLSIKNNKKHAELLQMVVNLNIDYENFDWISEDKKKLYLENLNKIETILKTQDT